MTVAEKFNFILRIWPENLLMVILRDSHLVIFSPSTIFRTFFYKNLGGFLFKLIESSRRRKREVALDFCVWPLCARGFVFNFQPKRSHNWVRAYKSRPRFPLFLKVGYKIPRFECFCARRFSRALRARPDLTDANQPGFIAFLRSAVSWLLPVWSCDTKMLRNETHPLLNIVML